MIVRKKHLLLALLLAAFTGTCLQGMADPLTVTYTATQVAGVEWQYDYVLSGAFAVGDDLAIYFPLATSSSLNDLATGGPDWTTFAFQPDPSLPADGEFDMLANIDNPSLTPTFSIQFVYSGVGSPGTQNFILYDPDFNIVTSGVTQPVGETSPVPEPASFLLLGSGFTALVEVRRRRA